MVEERIADLYPEQEMRCPVHLSIGQEGVAVGVCAALSPQDYVLSGHRSHGHYLAKGGDLKAMMAELYGKVTGCSQGKGGSMHLVDLSVGFLGATPIVASTIPIAVGAAFGSVMRGERRATVAFFGEAATEEGVFAESLNFAVLKDLPVVFVCENNLYSVYSPLSVRQPAERDLVQIAQGHGANALRGDGNDVAEVYRLALQAVDRAMRGEGPTLLELATYRWREHVGPYYDNDLGYRTEAEFLAWKERDPVEQAKAALLADGTLSGPQVEEMERRIAGEIAEAVTFARESPFPPKDLLAEHLYA
jgi:pyruvate dehydrogenase E1 component alpha subunit